MPFSIDTGAGGNTGGGSIPNGIFVLDVYDNSSDLALFIDLVDNPGNYKGSVIYVRRLEQVENRNEWPDPFLFPNKFYFNEDGEWFESPFSFSGGVIFK